MHLIYTAKALRCLESLPYNAQKKVLDKIEQYAQQPNPLRFAKRLTGYNAYRFRVGVYRVLFEVHDEIIFVLKVMKRDEVYRDL